MWVVDGLVEWLGVLFGVLVFWVIYLYVSEFVLFFVSGCRFIGWGVGIVLVRVEFIDCYVGSGEDDIDGVDVIVFGGEFD